MSERATHAPIARLRRIRDAAAAGVVLGADGLWLAAGLDAYLRRAPDGLTLPAALGLTVPAGGLPWWRTEDLAARDAALRQLAAEHYGSLRVTERSAAIAVALARYAASAWQHDQRQLRCPDRHVGEAAELLFAILKAGGTVLSERHIRRILNGRSQTRSRTTMSAMSGLHTLRPDFPATPDRAKN